MRKLIRKMIRELSKPKFTRFRNLKLFEWMNEHACGKKVLNLGSGVRQFDHYLSKDIRTIDFDIDPCKTGLDVAGDAHLLPFKSESFDVVYTIAVLEHVKRPWVVADEIHRILRPSGYLVMELPFLNIIHNEEDYFRFTDKGIKSLFGQDKFEVVFEQVGSGGGSFISVFLYTYLRQFIPTHILKVTWDVFMRYFFYLFKYADVLIDRSETMRLTANSFSYIGRKR
jgi:SAM-dependent methyltransferase